MNYQSAIKTLEYLFNSCGMHEEFQYALSQEQECFKATLHGLVDSAFSEFGDASEFVAILADELKTCKGYIEDYEVERRFPDIEFIQTEYGLQFKRGRVFSFADYELAKECLASFTDNFEKQFTNLQPKYYLY